MPYLNTEEPESESVQETETAGVERPGFLDKEPESESESESKGSEVVPRFASAVGSHDHQQAQAKSYEVEPADQSRWYAHHLLNATDIA